MARDGKVNVQLYSTCFLISVSLLNAFLKKMKSKLEKKFLFGKNNKNKDITETNILHILISNI